MGTSFHLLASAVQHNPSALETIGRDKADRLLQHAEASSTSTQVRDHRPVSRLYIYIYICMGQMKLDWIVVYLISFVVR